MAETIVIAALTAYPTCCYWQAGPCGKSVISSERT